MRPIARWTSMGILLWLSFGCRPSLNSEARVIKVGLTHGAQHSFTQALDRWAKEVDQVTDGKLQLRIFHSSQLGGEEEMQEMLAVGSLDVCVTGTISTYESLFALFELPYLYRDRAHAMKVNGGPIAEEVGRSLEAKGLRLIGFYENGFRHISNSMRPINEPKDLEGLLIRTPENLAQIETIRALGGIPTPMSFSELYTALLQGVVDGQENPLQNIWNARLYEAQPFIAKTGHIYNAAYVVASNRFWEGLGLQNQETLGGSLASSTAWQLSYMENLDQRLEKDMLSEGVTFTTPDQTVFAQTCEQAYEALYEQLGPEARSIVERIKNTQ